MTGARFPARRLWTMIGARFPARRTPGWNGADRTGPRGPVAGASRPSPGGGAPPPLRPWPAPLRLAFVIAAASAGWAVLILGTILAGHLIARALG